MTTSFTPAPGLDRVEFGADPVVVLAAGAVYSTHDELQALELQHNPHLIETKAKAAKTKNPRTPRKKTPAAPAPDTNTTAAAAATGGELA